MKPWGSVCLSALVAFASLLAPLPTASAPAQDWNASGIAWKSYEEGLQQAKRDGKPVCLVIYTTWCPHCTAYARLFHDPKVVASARGLVMVKLDRDANRAVSAKYARDGEYIPRTYFLSSSGEIAAIDAGRSDYRYFYAEDDPRQILGAMQRALALPH